MNILEQLQETINEKQREIESLENEKYSREVSIKIDDEEYTFNINVTSIYGDGSVTNYYVIDGDTEKLNVEHAFEAVNYAYPSFDPVGQDCHHEYDCCANWYPSDARFKKVSSYTAMVSQSFLHNV